MSTTLCGLAAAQIHKVRSRGLYGSPWSSVALPPASLLGDPGFFISLRKSELPWGGGRRGHRDNSFERPQKLQLSAQPGKGRYSA